MGEGEIVGSTWQQLRGGQRKRKDLSHFLLFILFRYKEGAACMENDIFIALCDLMESPNVFLMS